jgi:tight adherence protein B
MPPVAPAIIAFTGAFAASMAGALVTRTRARRREARIISRIGVRDEQDRAENRPAVLIAPSAAGQSGPLQRVLAKTAINARLAKMCERAGEAPDPAAVLRRCATAFLVTVVAGLAILPKTLALCAIPAGLLCGLVPLRRIAGRVRKRLALFESQFPDGLEFIARSMRAGHAFSVSLEMLHREFEDPMAVEFRRAFEEQNLGLPLEIALAKFADRTPLVDVRFFTSAVLLQRKTGGNLTEILDNLAHLIRERYKLRGKIRAISAHGRMTGKALTAIPVFVGLLMFWMNPDYRVFFLNTTLGREMLAAAVALQVIGYAVINYIVKIEV